MQKLRYPLIAFVGYGRTGKDSAAEPLIQAGYNRVAFGDIIKSDLDPVIQKTFGFSAFTQVTEEKAKFRRTAEYYGEDAYQSIFERFFSKLVAPAVNVRLCRLPEAQEWVRRGGILVNVRRPGVGPETAWSAEVNLALQTSGLIHSQVNNCGTMEQLHETIRALYL